MLVSVIIPVYNRESFISKAVESVLNQTYKNFEIIVVDDGSIDETYFSILHLTSDKRLSYYLLNENKGVSFARNYGIKHADGKFIAFLDSDDYWLPEKLEKQVKYMLENNLKICQTDEYWLRKNRFVNPKKKHKKISGNIFYKSLELCIVSPSAVMLDREVFENVGMFDEKMPACEDYDLWLRVSLKYNVGLFEEKLIVKRGGHEDQLSRNFGLDKYRIYSLLKLLENNNLSYEKREKTVNVLKNKLKIYIAGCKKRFKTEEVGYYLRILNDLNFISN